MLKKILQFVVILPFLFLSACSVTSTDHNNSTANQQTQHIYLIIESSESITYQIDFKNNETVLNLMKRFSSEQKDFSFETEVFEGIGEFVTSINNQKADKNKEFWAFWINDKESSVGIGDYILKPEDKIKFKLTAFSQ